MKTHFLNSLRQVVKIESVERILLQASLKGNSLAKKIIGPNTVFPAGTMRKCTRNGINYVLDISDYMDHAVYFGFSDLLDFDREDLYSMVQPHQVIFDVGGNIGDTALHFAKLQKNTGKIFCFEPVPHLFKRLKHNVSINDFKGISIHNIALSDKKEDLFFNLPQSQNSGGIFLSDNITEESKKVSSVPLDEFCSENQIDKIDVIKIDVEGFELKVLKGAMLSLKKFKPKMFIEINDLHLHRAGGSAKEVMLLLEQVGYKITRADTNETITSDYDFANKHFDIVCG